MTEKSLREKIYNEIDTHWNEVLFDGENIVNACSIPREMYVCIWNQVYEKLWPLIFKYKLEFGYRNEVINCMNPISLTRRKEREE